MSAARKLPGKIRDLFTGLSALGINGWDRLRDRLQDRLWDPLQDRVRDRGGSAPLLCLPCTYVVFLGVSQCDISMSAGEVL